MKRRKSDPPPDDQEALFAPPVKPKAEPLAKLGRNDWKPPPDYEARRREQERRRSKS